MLALVEEVVTERWDIQQDFDSLARVMVDSEDQRLYVEGQKICEEFDRTTGIFGKDWADLPEVENDG